LANELMLVSWETRKYGESMVEVW